MVIGRFVYFDADLKPNTTYTISFKGTEGNKVYFNENIFVSSAWNTQILNGTTSATLTTKPVLNKTDNSQYANGRWIICKNSQLQPNDNHFEEIQLEEGTIATSYEPYKEAISNINLNFKGIEREYEIYPEDSFEIINI